MVDMDTAIHKHFRQSIKERVQLTGGYSFKTWLLLLSNDQKVVFRTRADFVTGGGRKIVIADVFEREKFFYDAVNLALGHICPEVYVIDSSCEDYATPFQIAEYMEGAPLNTCFDSFGQQQKDEVYYRLGEITAGVNKLVINAQHPYILSRGIWEDFFVERLCERLVPLIKNEVVTEAEIEKIAVGMKDKKAERTLSFLHLDLRFINMIYNAGQIYLLDAENCEFGDPLFELAVLDMNEMLTESFLAGYVSVFGSKPDLENELFNYYKMERLALVLNVFMNTVKTDEAMTRHFLTLFSEVKHRLLGM